MKVMLKRWVGPVYGSFWFELYPRATDNYKSNFKARE